MRQKKVKKLRKEFKENYKGDNLKSDFRGYKKSLKK